MCIRDSTNDPSFIEISQQEFASLPEALGNAEAVEQLGGNRRDFMKMLGFGVGAAAIAASCDIPVKRAIPYSIKPDTIVPGVATYYATTYVNGNECAPILVKTREGRPIKIEGNDLIGYGGTSARAQASVLSLYDTARFKSPSIKGGDASWMDVDKKAMEILSGSRSVALITPSVFSPSIQKAIDAFVAKYNATHVQYDSVSHSALLDSNESAFGKRAFPNYHFDKAEVVVSFDADFMGNWGDGEGNTVAFMSKRKLKDENGKMNRLYQVESHMSLTGSNADNRVLVKPSEQGAAIVALYNAVVGGSLSGGSLNADAKKSISLMAADLKKAAGKSLVVCGTNNVAEHTLVNAINDALGNIGKTMDMSDALMTYQGDDKAMGQLMNQMNSGSVDTVVLMGVNPAYDFSSKGKFADALGKVKNKLAISYQNNESVDGAMIIAPTHHYLESWGDAQPKASKYMLMQPAINKIYDTRQEAETLLTWAGVEYGSIMDFVSQNFEANAFQNQSASSNSKRFWQTALHDGFVNIDVPANGIAFSGAASATGITKSTGGDAIEMKIYEASIGNGANTNNPWLMEMPDPVTRTSWGNYLAIPVDFDGVRRMISMNGLKDGDLVDVSVNGQTITVPVVQQFGQAPGTVALALGYGRSVAGACAIGVGEDMNPFISMDANGNRTYSVSGVEISKKKGKEEHYSSVQYHHTYGVKDTDKKTGEMINADEAALVTFDYGLGVEGFQGSLTDRSVMYYSSLSDLKENVQELHKKREHAQHLNDQQIYGGHDYKYENGHHWGMHVDLTTCTGCAACTVACMAENNVPVVGKEEVSRHHEMTWLRIDRYYYGKLENPNTVYQPMMCQHCDNAPCENVCPVNATNHSSEGLNQMTYNRCVGTRYCANNCPYKVRRFNWLDYTTADIFPGNQPALTATEDVPFGADNLTRMVLNPDVTVRSRGVIEKCSFCVQRIQSGKLTAKLEGRKLRDSDVKTACQTACSTGAITFGDMNNKGGNLDTKLKNPLNFIVLEEVNVRSSVQYQMRVNNRNEKLDA